jgi:hypothetical protein
MATAAAVTPAMATAAAVTPAMATAAVLIAAKPEDFRDPHLCTFFLSLGTSLPERQSNEFPR